MNNHKATLASAPSKRGFYYGYIILAICFCIMTLAFGAQYSFGVFFKPMLNEFNWTRAGTAGPAALYMGINGIMSIVSGRLSDRLGPRKVVTAGAILMGLGYILSSQATQIWQLYVYYGILGATGLSVMYVPVVSSLTRWFVHRRGLIAGIGISGIGFGIGVVPPLASKILEIYGWRTSMLALGLITLPLIVIMAQFLKGEPSPEEFSYQKHSQSEPFSQLQQGFSFKEAIRTWQFKVMFLAWVFYGFGFQTGQVHIVPYATDLGMTPMAASTVLVVIGLVGVFGRISVGFISDRLGNKRTFLIGFSFLTLSFVGLTVSDSIWMLYGFAVIFGAFSGIGILLSATAAEYFGYKDLGTISGAIVFANCLGGAIGPTLAGGIYDITNSYYLAFLGCAILGLATALLLWSLKIPLKNT